MPNKKVPANERNIRHGGLMRCCLDTWQHTTTPTEVGDVLDCKYEPVGNSQMVVAEDGVWEWNKPEVVG